MGVWKGSCSLAEQRFELRHYDIQCWGSVTFWYGSVSSDPYLWLTNPDADLGGPKTYGSYGSGCGFGKLVHLHHSSKIKSHKEVTKQYKPRVFLLFLFDGGRILSRIRYCNWRIRCGSRRPKNIRIWIRVLIRILNTADTLPAHVPTPETKRYLRRERGPQKRHTIGPRSLCRELKRRNHFCTVFSVISFLWLKVGQSDCMIVWLRAIPTTIRPAKSARDCKSAFHTPFYHSSCIPLFLSSTVSFFLHIIAFCFVS